MFLNNNYLVVNAPAITLKHKERCMGDLLLLIYILCCSCSCSHNGPALSSWQTLLVATVTHRSCRSRNALVTSGKFSYTVQGVFFLGPLKKDRWHPDMEQRQTDQETLQTDLQLGSFLSHRTPKVPSHLKWPKQLELSVTTAVSRVGNMIDLTVTFLYCVGHMDHHSLNDFFTQVRWQLIGQSQMESRTSLYYGHSLVAIAHY